MLENKKGVDEVVYRIGWAALRWTLMVSEGALAKMEVWRSLSATSGGE